MTAPLTTWCCDVCRDPISSVAEGYVIWQSPAPGTTNDFKIIHKVKCDIKSFPMSAELSDFVGERGLVYLTSFLSLGPIKLSLGQPSHTSIDAANMDAFVDFFRRVQVPFYEEARVKFANPVLKEDRSDDNELGPYLPETLKFIAERY